MPHLSRLPLLSSGMPNQRDGVGLQVSLSGNGTDSQQGGCSPEGACAYLPLGHENEVSIPSSPVWGWYGAPEGGGLPLFRAGSGIKQPVAVLREPSPAPVMRSASTRSRCFACLLVVFPSHDLMIPCSSHSPS